MRQSVLTRVVEGSEDLSGLEDLDSRTDSTGSSANEDLNLFSSELLKVLYMSSLMYNV